MLHADLKVLPHGAGIDAGEVRSDFVVEPDWVSFASAFSTAGTRTVS